MKKNIQLTINEDITIQWQYVEESEVYIKEIKRKSDYGKFPIGYHLRMKVSYFSGNINDHLLNSILLNEEKITEFLETINDKFVLKNINIESNSTSSHMFEQIMNMHVFKNILNENIEEHLSDDIKKLKNKITQQKKLINAKINSLKNTYKIDKKSLEDDAKSFNESLTGKPQ